MASNKQIRKWLNDEACLSGSDAGSDDEAGDNNLDFYEPMEGDDDGLSENEIREGILRTHMTLQNRDDERNLNMLQGLYDTELNPSKQWDRGFRTSLRAEKLDLKALAGNPLDDDNFDTDDDEEDEIITFKAHLERKQVDAEAQEERRLFTLSMFDDELMQDTIERQDIGNEYVDVKKGAAKNKDLKGKGKKGAKKEVARVLTLHHYFQTIYK